MGTRTACFSHTPLSPGRCCFSPAFESSRMILGRPVASLFSSSDGVHVSDYRCGPVCRERSARACPRFCRCAPRHRARFPAHFGLCAVFVISRGCGTCYPLKVHVITHRLGRSHGLFCEDKVVQIPSGGILPPNSPVCAKSGAGNATKGEDGPSLK